MQLSIFCTAPHRTAPHRGKPYVGIDRVCTVIDTSISSTKELIDTIQLDTVDEVAPAIETVMLRHLRQVALKTNINVLPPVNLPNAPITMDTNTTMTASST